MLRRLADLIHRFRQPREVGNAYDLSDAQLHALARIRTFEEWEAVCVLVDGIVAVKAETIIYTDDPAKNAFLRGYVAAIRELPLAIERLAKQVEDGRARANAGKPSHAADRRTAALYATPSWSERGETDRA